MASGNWSPQKRPEANAINWSKMGLHFLSDCHGQGWWNIQLSIVKHLHILYFISVIKKTRSFCIYQNKKYIVIKRHLMQKFVIINTRTFQRCISPVSITDLHMVVPAQVTSVQIHWSKIKNDLTKRMKHRQKEREVKSQKRLFLKIFKEVSHTHQGCF